MSKGTSSGTVAVVSEAGSHDPTMIGLSSCPVAVIAFRLPSAQALRATQELHANIAAEHRAMHDVTAFWHATVTPHQTLRGELAAWPHGMSPLRMIQYMGVSADHNVEHQR